MCLKVGYDLKEEIERKFDKWQEPPPVKQVKPLPAPLDGQRKKRGGRRCLLPCTLKHAQRARLEKPRAAFSFNGIKVRFVPVFPKVPEDEGASRADGDQETR